MNDLEAQAEEIVRSEWICAQPQMSTQPYDRAEPSARFFSSSGVRQQLSMFGTALLIIHLIGHRTYLYGGPWPAIVRRLSNLRDDQKYALNEALLAVGVETVK